MSVNKCNDTHPMPLALWFGFVQAQETQKELLLCQLSVDSWHSAFLIRALCFFSKCYCECNRGRVFQHLGGTVKVSRGNKVETNANFTFCTMLHLYLGCSLVHGPSPNLQQYPGDFPTASNWWKYFLALGLSPTSQPKQWPHQGTSHTIGVPHWHSRSYGFSLGPKWLTKSWESLVSSQALPCSRGPPTRSVPRTSQYFVNFPFCHM